MDLFVWYKRLNEWIYTVISKMISVGIYFETWLHLQIAIFRTCISHRPNAFGGGVILWKHKMIVVFCGVKQWRDALLQWNASEYDNVRQVVLQPRQIWTPDVVLVNA